MAPRERYERSAPPKGIALYGPGQASYHGTLPERQWQVRKRLGDVKAQDGKCRVLVTDVWLVHHHALSVEGEPVETPMERFLVGHLKHHNEV